MFNIHHTFKLIYRTFRIIKMENCKKNFPVPAIMETTMEALPLLAIYLFNSGKLYLVLKIC